MSRTESRSPSALPERYRNLAALNPPPASSWGKLLRRVPDGSKVLDFGCGQGAFGAALKTFKACSVTGVEKDAGSAEVARSRLDEVRTGNIEAELQAGTLGRDFDVVIASDVLEHLVDPGAVLAQLRGCLKHGGVLLASIPNVTHFSVVAAMIHGRFPRRVEGLLDDTHVQFFGEADVLQLFHEHGYSCRIEDRVRMDPRETEFKTELDSVPAQLMAAMDLNPNADTYQFIVRAVPREWADSADDQVLAADRAPGHVRDVLVRDINALQSRLGQLETALTTRQRDLDRLRSELETVKDRARHTPWRRLERPLSTDERTTLSVLYVVSRHDGSYRYRVHQACEQLRDAGVIANVMHLDAPDLLGELSGYGVVVLWRLPWSPYVKRLIEQCRALNTRVGMDVDWSWLVTSERSFSPATLRERGDWKPLLKTLECVDFAVAPTMQLALLMRRHVRSAVVHPDLLSQQSVALSPAWVAAHERRLHTGCWLGLLCEGASEEADFEYLAPALATVLREHPEAHLFVSGTARLPPELRPFRRRVALSAAEPPEIQTWDWIRCRAMLDCTGIRYPDVSRSASRIFEAGLLGVPAVAVPWGVDREPIEHGVSGFLARTLPDWADSVAQLCDLDVSLRAGRGARQLALAERTPMSHANVLARALVPYARKPLLPARRRPLPGLGRRGRLRGLRGQAVALLRGLTERAPRARVADENAWRRMWVETWSGSNPLRELVSAADRDGLHLLHEGKRVGMVLAERASPPAQTGSPLSLELLEASMTPGTAFLTEGMSGRVIFSVPSRTPAPDFLVLELCIANPDPFQVTLRWTGVDGRGPELPLSWEIEGGRRLLSRVDLRDWAPTAWGSGEGISLELTLSNRPVEAELATVALLQALTEEELAAISSGLRKALSHRYLQGQGMEIGALRSPFPVPAESRVLQVDRLTPADARQHYPELSGSELVTPGLVAEADRLGILPAKSQDFVIASHLLQQMRDPIGALEEWLRVLRPGGKLYVSVPSVSHSREHGNPVTGFGHLVLDHQKRGQRAQADLQHYADWVRSTRPELKPDEQRRHSRELMASRYAAHLHVFDLDLFAELLRYVCIRAGARVLELLAHREGTLDEIIAVLER